MSSKWSRRGALALIGGGTGLLLVDLDASNIFRSERDIDLDTASDPNALLGIDEKSETRFGTTAVRGLIGGQVTLQVLTNQLGESAEINATITGFRNDDTSFDLIKNLKPATATTVSDGEAIAVTGDVNADASLDVTESVVLELTANSANQSVTATREVKFVADRRSSYWNFDTIGVSAGTTVDNEAISDEAVLGNDGEYTGFVDTSGRTKFGRIRDQSHVLEAPDNSSYDFTTTNEFTLSLYAFASGNNISAVTNTDQVLFDKTGTGTNGLRMFLRRRADSGAGSGTGDIFISSDGTESEIKKFNEYDPDGDGTSNAWHHIVWVHDNDASPMNRVYVTVDDTAFNGENHLDPAGDVKEFTDDTVGFPTSTNAPLRVGNAVDSNGNLAFRWTNAIDEPKLYDFAITEAQVQNLFDTSKAGSGGGGGNINP